ncbi:regulatory protein RecX [Promicromonospora sp. AC04]|uniref:regulatory protein RecX n=1 Tax=Promicromonospora sp. AC04 TaxID=2135723 RepID=UPI000D37B43D|nr:regulatory protein RecX [Promicromonospora sp. AC04]
MGKRRGHPAARKGGFGRRDSAEQAPRRTVAERMEAGEISRDDAVEKAREVVLRILTAAQRSRRELEQSLARKGYPEDVVVQVLDRFDEVGLVDDATYAETIVRTRHAERGLARRGIAAELRRRGIDEDTATDALDQLDPDDERVAGAKLATKLITRTRSLDRQVRVRRAVGSLARKGYAPGLAFELVRDALAAEGEETDDLMGVDID